MTRGYTIGLICARGGSKGVPRKNLRALSGKPLIGWAIEVARKCPSIDRVVISTEDEEIARVARSYGAEVPFLRPNELAQDDSPELHVWQHVLRTLAALDDRMPDLLVNIPAVSPLRAVEDVEACISGLLDYNADLCITVKPADRNPYFTMMKIDEGWASPLITPPRPIFRRQDAPEVFDIVPVAYAARADFVLRTQRLLNGKVRAIKVPPERSVDIDTELDLAFVEFLLERKETKPDHDSDELGIPLHQNSMRLAKNMPRMGTIHIGSRKIGSGEPVFIIAEAGVNHNGDLEIAEEMVDAAADAGADAVKFQTFRADEVVSASAPKARYQIENTGEGGSQLEMIKRLELSPDSHRKLIERCQARGIMFLSTPFDFPSADLLEGLSVPAYKVPSGEITNWPFLEHIASKRKPVILSTGMSYLNEVEQAVKVLRAAGCSELVILHATSSYPAAAASANLRAMQTLADCFHTPVGLSDHTTGIEVALAATALGASILEKHFTLDRSMAGPDHKASLEPAELRSLVRGVRTVESALGDGRKQPVPSEEDVRRVARRSIVACRTIPSGTLMARDLLAYKRPGTGIPPSRLKDVIGRKTTRTIPADTLIRFEDLE
jgi:N-acetylneuraminate synthase/N,N'-diacetyllegionaminate synthase